MRNIMFKRIKITITMLMIIALLITLSSCKKAEEEKIYNTEEDALCIGFVTDDLKVNPFFIESSAEREICSYMFSQFLSTNVSGDIVYGEDYNTVVKDMNMYYENENHTKSDTFKTGYYPVYEFVLKKGMKFSDDVEITYDDVLFNLYTYLNNAYYGLNTLYTLPIEGLDEYNNQITKTNLTLYTTIGEELKADYLAQNGKYVGSKRAYTYDEWLAYEEVLKNEVYSLFEKLIYPNVGGYEKFEIPDVNHFIKNFLIERGLAGNFKVATSETTGYIIKDGYKYELKSSNTGDFIIASVDKKLTVLTYNNLSAEDKELYASNKHYTIGNLVVENLFYLSDGTGVEIKGYEDLYNIFIDLYTNNSGTIQFEKFIDTELKDYTNSNKFFENVLNEFVKKENEGNEAINTISGISVVKIDGVDTLRIKLTKDDNTILEKLTFFVAPKHYYTAGYNNKSKVSNYGVPLNDNKFMNNLKSYSYSPVGSGPYKMIFDGTYKNDGYIYLERNKYFETMKGSDSTSNNIKNANIKYLKIYSLDEGTEYEALKNGTVSYIKTSLSINLSSKLTMNYGIALCDSLDYGSIVINPSIITNLYERKALQSVIDASKVYNYYPENITKLINYNSSTVYSIYPSKTKVTSAYDETLNKAIEYFVQAGYEYDDNSKTFVKAPSYAFYLDVKEEDSPFGAILYNAQVLLESLGISVRIDTKSVRTGAIYSIYASNNTCALDFDLTYKFTQDRKSIYVINNQIKELYDLGFDTTEGMVMWDVSSINTKLSQSMAIDYINRLISELNTISDETEQKAKYEEILKCYNDLAIEVPIYQTYDLYVYDLEVIDEDSLSGKINFLYSPLAEVWKVTYVK